jgi:hypothetical protein
MGSNVTELLSEHEVVWIAIHCQNKKHNKLLAPISCIFPYHNFNIYLFCYCQQSSRVKLQSAPRTSHIIANSLLIPSHFLLSLCCTSFKVQLRDDAWESAAPLSTPRVAYALSARMPMFHLCCQSFVHLSNVQSNVQYCCHRAVSHMRSVSFASGGCLAWFMETGFRRLGHGAIPTAGWVTYSSYTFLQTSAISVQLCAENSHCWPRPSLWCPTGPNKSSSYLQTEWI